MSRSTTKKAAVRPATSTSRLEVVKETKTTKKRASKTDDYAVMEYVLNAHKGEKKTEAGIKYWFEQNVSGHQTEDNTGQGAPDGYTPGWLVLELKGKQQDWLEGLFQGLSRKDLSFKLLVVVCHNRLLIFPGPKSAPGDWDDLKKSEWKKIVTAATSLPGSPNKVGKTLAAQYKSKPHLLIRFSIFQWSPEEDGTLIPISQTQDEALQIFKHIVTAFDSKSARIEITPKNFSSILKSLLPYFDPTLEKQFEVVHGFFRSMSYWNQKHVPIISEDPSEHDRVYFGAGYFEGLLADSREQFIKSVQQYEVIDADKSKFYAHYDSAIDAVDPDYRANNGIYFTNEYLARLAITLSEKHLGSISEKYIVFDPACGSGNLVTSWNHHLDLRHKVVSEISPILLKAFELRFQGKSTERKRGFTIIPKTSSGQGLNFVSQDASTYLEKINKELKESGHKLNKPLAIVCNPPYRNQKDIKDDFYKYDIDPSLVKIVGGDGSKELFVAFLAQITEICRVAEENNFPPNSVVLLFTQSGWLTGKSSYSKVRDYFLQRFNYKMGFVVNSSEFFTGTKSWPLVVSLWEFSPEKLLEAGREIKLRNFLSLKRAELKELVNDSHKDFDDLTHWGADDLFLKRLEKTLKVNEGSQIIFNKKIKKLKEAIPVQAGDGNQQISLEMIENEQFLGGLCFADESQVSDREKKFNERVRPVIEENQELRKKGKKLKKMPSYIVLGNALGTRVGFTEGKQPYRTNRPFENDGSNLFFLMDTRFHKMHTSQCLSGVPPKRGHVVSELDEKGRMLIQGYAMAHSLAGNVPDQFNQYDMWVPEGTDEQISQLWDLSCALVFTLNSCIECEIPKDHPLEGSSRAYVVNPLSPNRGTFWQSKLLPLVRQTNVEAAKNAIDATTKYYAGWKKWFADHPSYRAKAKLPIYQHPQNRVPGDGWGIYQIEQEIKLLPDEANLQKLSLARKEAIKALKAAIVGLMSDMGYWG